MFKKLTDQCKLKWAARFSVISIVAVPVGLAFVLLGYTNVGGATMTIGFFLIWTLGTLVSIIRRRYKKEDNPDTQ